MRTTTKGACSVEGCDRKRWAKALCSRHWFKAYSVRPDGPACGADGCQRTAVAGGFCPAHYQRWRNGDVAAHRPVATYSYWTPEEDACIARVLESVQPGARVEDGLWVDVALILGRHTEPCGVGQRL